MKRRGRIAVLWTIAALLAPGVWGSDTPPPAAEEEPAEWQRVAPGGETGCALGTPYSFFHRDGTDDERLLVYFEGGGACWNWVSCSGMFDTSVDDDEPSEFRGIFDREHPDNPFAADEMLFVPYCTGDVHVGDASHRYGDDPSARPIAHLGYRNVTAALDWLAARHPHPKTVVVAGTSAGAYGALFYTPEVARRFPGARIVMLGDSGVPLLNDYDDDLDTWGTGAVLDKLWRRDPTAEAARSPLLEAYRQAARGGDRVRLAQITSDQDAVQGAFYLVSGSPEWRTATYTLLRDAKELAPSLRTFIVEGSDHGLLHGDGFYTYRASGVYLKDWVGQLVRGELVSDVRCRECRPN